MGKTTTTLTSVKTKDGNSAKGPWLLSIFAAADGREYATFKGELASKANSLIGKAVELEYTEKQNGQYTNYTLEGVSAAGAGEVAVVTEAPVTQNAGVTYAPKSNDQFRTKEQIMRTDALLATAQFFTAAGLDPILSSDEFFQWFETNYRLIEQGVFETPDVRVEA